MTLIELKRLCSEWRMRAQRVQEILQPPVWSNDDWNQFALTLVGVIRKYGKNWETDGTMYADLRWDLSEGGELACQFEDTPGGKRSLVVAQHGGFANGLENYIWFYAEFNEGGRFIGDPYFVSGNWKDALAILLMPHKSSANLYLAAPAAPLQNLLLGGPETDWEDARNGGRESPPIEVEAMAA
jgi:hypothetical protein